MAKHVTCEEAAELKNCDRMTIYRAIKSKKIGHKKVGHMKFVIVNKKFEDWQPKSEHDPTKNKTEEDVNGSI